MLLTEDKCDSTSQEELSTDDASETRLRTRITKVLSSLRSNDDANSIVRGCVRMSDSTTPQNHHDQIRPRVRRHQHTPAHVTTDVSAGALVPSPPCLGGGITHPCPHEGKLWAARYTETTERPRHDKRRAKSHNAPQSLEETVETVKVVPRERVQQRTAEKLGEVLETAPQTKVERRRGWFGF